MLSLNTTFQLNNGIAMPALGFGVYRSAPDETSQAVAAALRNGYQLIDTAAAYGNEAEVGEGIRDSGVHRDQVFVTTKLWIMDYGFDSALRAFDTSLNKLGLDTIDLYLLHQPMPREFDMTVAAWQAAEKLLADGRVRAIGVCNFSSSHLAALAERTDVTPAINQVELHPFFVQEELRQTHAERGIVSQAWSPIGGVNRYFTENPDPEDDPLTHSTIVSIAKNHDKTAAQVMLRWHLQRGVAVIPKSVNPARIAENIDLFDFKLSDDEIQAINTLDRGQRGGPDPETLDTSYVRSKR